LAARRWLLMTMAAALLLVHAAGLAQYTIRDVTLGEGSPDALRTKVLHNDRTGEYLQVVTASGGKTARLRLLSPVTGKLRDVLVPLTDASAIRDTADGIHYAGSILAPFANRVANGSYHFFGQPHYLPRNECPEGVRCDALHGFLFNRSLDVMDLGTLSSSADSYGAYLTLGYSFDGASTPGWPYRANVNVTYTLRSRTPPSSPDTVLTITIRAVNMQTDGGALPWTASWHPYFLVSDVSAAKVRFDPCGGNEWRHLLVGPGGPRGGDLIPTGHTEAWTKFDGATPLGGTAAKPTYMDDEFKATKLGCKESPADPSSIFPNEATIAQRIIDGNESVVLAAQTPPFRTWQIFTGAKEGWGWDAIALEPMSGLADAFNNGEGLTVLDAGEVFEASFGVRLERA